MTVEWLQSEYGYTNDPINLNQEIECFIRYIEPTEYEIELRKYIISKYESILNQNNYLVSVFGSTSSTLFLPTSDIDMNIYSKEAYYRLTNQDLRSFYHLFGTMIDKSYKFFVGNATVPVMKLKDRESELILDLSYDNFSGSKVSRYMHEEMKKNASIRKLLLVIKMILYCNDFHVPSSGGLGTYSLFIMICFSLNEREHYSNDLGELLMNFFHLFSTFDSDKYGIKANGNVFDRKERNWDQRLSCIAIEDPCDESNNVSVSSAMWPYIKILFKCCFTALYYTNETKYDHTSSLLSRIISVPKHFIDIRKKWKEMESKVHQDQTMSISLLDSRNKDVTIIE